MANTEVPWNRPADESSLSAENDEGRNVDDTDDQQEGDRNVPADRPFDTPSHTGVNKLPTNQKQSLSDVDDEEPLSDRDIAYGERERDLLESVLKNDKNAKLIDCLLGCAYGQALGDAYGLSTEFETRGDVAYNYPDQSTLIPFPGYVLTHHNRRWKLGDWTDDTDQWILILETLLDSNGDPKVFAKRLKGWIQRGYPELGDYGGMGLGANVSQVVHSPGYVDNPLQISEAVWERGGRQAAPNGAVMRCSASALVHFRDMDKMKSTTIDMCRTTHCDPRCIASCLAVCLAIAYLLRGESADDDIEALVKRVQDETIEILGTHFPQEQRDQFLWHTDKARTLEELDLDESRSIGYTYKCLGAGFYGLRSTESFEKTLNDLIRYGGDADTNGAVCGTMYGARHGYKKLPYKWLRAMPYKKWFDKKLIKCFGQIGLLNTNASAATD